tara:strand:+ start:393 stop:644 length:252 start_codon:yes stop_codon:yes gene_type:complete
VDVVPLPTLPMNGICRPSSLKVKNPMIHPVVIGYFYPTNQIQPGAYFGDRAGTGMVTGQHLSINLSKKIYQKRLTFISGDYII